MDQVVLIYSNSFIIKCSPLLCIHSHNLLVTTASSSVQFLFLFSCLVFSSISYTINAQNTTFKPTAVFLPISKDATTLQYTTIIHQRTPTVPVKVVVDLEGKVLWVNCDEDRYVSSSYHVTRCGSSRCSMIGSTIPCGVHGCTRGPKEVCHDRICFSDPFNPFERASLLNGTVTEDVLSIQSTNGQHPGPNVTIPRFAFTCSTSFFLYRLSNDAMGIAGLGWTRSALQAQFSVAFKLKRKFAVCLPSSSEGIAFFGGGPYRVYPGYDVSEMFSYTPLLSNSRFPVDSLESRSKSYYIGVKSIVINSKTMVPLNTSMLSIDRNGNGGTKLSTTAPYTLLHSSIYKPFTKAFLKEAHSMGMVSVPAVAPFGVCFNKSNIGVTQLGWIVPTIDLVLDKKTVSWKIFGSNSMVEVGDNVLCLGFVDDSQWTTTAIVIGGHQMENNLLEFDLAKSRLGFTSSLYQRKNTCGDFNLSP